VNRQQRRAASVQRTQHIRECASRAWEPFECVSNDLAWRAQHAKRLAGYAAKQGDLRACYLNNIYSVQVFARAREGMTEALHLVIRRHDEEEIRGWSDLQRIKNEIAGSDRVAVEIYPREEDVIDEANLRHLFVLGPGELAPFTIRGRWD
jgi:hypothetical protein